jgi:hypothetical protein
MTAAAPPLATAAKPKKLKTGKVPKTHNPLSTIPWWTKTWRQTKWDKNDNYYFSFTIYGGDPDEDEDKRYVQGFRVSHVPKGHSTPRSAFYGKQLTDGGDCRQCRAIGDWRSGAGSTFDSVQGLGQVDLGQARKRHRVP